MNKYSMVLVAALLLAPTASAFATGAIAVQDTAGDRPSDAGYGIGFGDDKDSAKEAAMAKCESAGNTNCKVQVWFEKCGAYASSNDKYGIGWGSTEAVAKDKAMDQCGNDSCRLVAASCGD